MVGVQLLQAAPQLLGVDQAQSYLVLAQNRDELRATGGFISGIGLLTIKDGKILQFDLGDSHKIDDFSKPYPKPPEPLKRFMLADYWVTSRRKLVTRISQPRLRRRGLSTHYPPVSRPRG